MFPEETTFDEAARFLLREGGGPLLSWLLAESPEALHFRRWLDSVLTLPGTKERLCDAIARLETPDGEPLALLVEVQTNPDASMFGRLCVAGGILWETVRPSDRYGLMALVINLTGNGNSGRTFRRASSVWELSPCEWDLADRDAETVLREVESGAVPLEALGFIPLMKKGGEDGIIGRWLELVGKEPDRRRRGTISVALVFSQLTKCTDAWKKAMEGFDAMESTIVKEWKAEAARKARCEAMAGFVLHCLRLRFGAVPEDVTRSVNACADVRRLESLHEAAVTAASLDDFRRVSEI